MTSDELNSVRDLQKKIRKLERKAQDLRLNVESIVPVLDGLPHATEAKSRVEKNALMIVDAERELDELRGQLDLAKSDLATRILNEVDKPLLQAVVVLRYVDCLSYKDVAHRLRLTLRHVFRLHEKFLKCHIVAQNHS